MMMKTLLTIFILSAFFINHLYDDEACPNKQKKCVSFINHLYDDEEIVVDCTPDKSFYKSSI